jgi:HPt (histidine-containing phosphotransfer) domain-containing protein
MLSLFVSSTESLLTDLARAVEQRDAVQAARQAHQIRGAAAYLGAGEEITGLAGEVEAHAKARDWDPCATAVEDLEAAFIRLRLEIDDQLGG